MRVMIESPTISNRPVMFLIMDTFRTQYKYVIASRSALDYSAGYCGNYVIGYTEYERKTESSRVGA